jgi:hypothetical protein
MQGQADAVYVLCELSAAAVALEASCRQVGLGHIALGVRRTVGCLVFFIGMTVVFLPPIPASAEFG